MKCKKIPILWRLFLLKIAKNMDYVNNFCNLPFNNFHQHCRERYFYKLTKNNTEMHYDNEFNNYFNNNVFLDEAYFDDDDNNNFPDNE